MDLADVVRAGVVRVHDQKAEVARLVVEVDAEQREQARRRSSWRPLRLESCSARPLASTSSPVRQYSLASPRSPTSRTRRPRQSRSTASYRAVRRAHRWRRRHSGPRGAAGSRSASGRIPCTAAVDTTRESTSASGTRTPALVVVSPRRVGARRLQVVVVLVEPCTRLTLPPFTPTAAVPRAHRAAGGNSTAALAAIRIRRAQERPVGREARRAWSIWRFCAIDSSRALTPEAHMPGR